MIRNFFLVCLVWHVSGKSGSLLTHWGRVTHICVGTNTDIGSDTGLSPGRRQAIIWTNAGILLTGHLGTNFSEILSEILTFSFKKIHLKLSSGKWPPFCLGRNVLILSFKWWSHFYKFDESCHLVFYNLLHALLFIWQHIHKLRRSKKKTIITKCWPSGGHKMTESGGFRLFSEKIVTQ